MEILHTATGYCYWRLLRLLADWRLATEVVQGLKNKYSVGSGSRHGDEIDCI